MSAPHDFTELATALQRLLPGAAFAEALSSGLTTGLEAES